MKAGFTGQVYLGWLRSAEEKWEASSLMWDQHSVRE